MKLYFFCLFLFVFSAASTATNKDPIEKEKGLFGLAKISVPALHVSQASLSSKLVESYAENLASILLSSPVEITGPDLKESIKTLLRKDGMKKVFYEDALKAISLIKSHQLDYFSRAVEEARSISKKDLFSFSSGISYPTRKLVTYPINKSHQKILIRREIVQFVINQFMDNDIEFKQAIDEYINLVNKKKTNIESEVIDVEVAINALLRLYDPFSAYSSNRVPVENSYNVKVLSVQSYLDCDSAQDVCLFNYNSELNNGMSGKVLRISSFKDGTGDRVREALSYLSDQEVVIDLRGNAGGLLNEAVDSLSYILPSQAFFVIRSADNSEIPFFDNKPQWHRGKMVVLIDENTASSAEAMAKVLQESNKAVIVGNRSYGKSMVLREYDLSEPKYNQSYKSDLYGTLTISVGNFYGKDNVDIQGVGIAPDLDKSKIVSYGRCQFLEQSVSPDFCNTLRLEYLPINKTDEHSIDSYSGLVALKKKLSKKAMSNKERLLGTKDVKTTHYEPDYELALSVFFQSKPN